jgi:hypothetical protein
MPHLIQLLAFPIWPRISGPRISLATWSIIFTAIQNDELILHEPHLCGRCWLDRINRRDALHAQAVRICKSAILPKLSRAIITSSKQVSRFCCSRPVLFFFSPLQNTFVDIDRATSCASGRSRRLNSRLDVISTTSTISIRRGSRTHPQTL